MHHTKVLAVSSSRHPSSTVTSTKWLWPMLAVGLLLRLYRLDGQSLWADEGLQYFVASADSLPEVFDRLRRTMHPPLSFVINHLFLQLGTSDVLLRLPSVLFGVGSLPLCYMVARRITSPVIAGLATLVLAVSPMHVWHSQDARMYAQLLFFSLLSTLFLVQALEQEKWQWWGGYVLAVTAGMYSQVLMALGVLTQGLWVLLAYRRHLRAYCTSGVAVGFLTLPLILPWLGFFVRRVHAAELETAAEVGGRLGFSWMALPYTFFAYSAGYSLGPSVADLHEERSVAFLLHSLPSIAAVGLLFGTLLIIGVWAVYKQCSRKALLLCLLGLGVPLGGLLVLSLLTRFTFNARYTIVALPYFYLLIGAALAFLWQRQPPVGVIAALAVMGLCTLSLRNYFFVPHYAKEDVRAAVTLWRQAASHEPLLSVSPAGGIRDAVNRYLAASERSQHTPLGGSRQVVERLNDFFSTSAASSATIILVRDWHQVRERAIRRAFPVRQEQTVSGGKVLHITRAP
jgi:4-amino-4-deoxy-L-arabinose transferase-like glycosyltransferase